MRDPERRKRILALIEEIWMRGSHQDMRLYQLLGNASGADSDPYDYEDEKLEADLEMYAKRPGSRPANDYAEKVQIIDPTPSIRLWTTG